MPQKYTVETPAATVKPRVITVGDTAPGKKKVDTRTIKEKLNDGIAGLGKAAQNLESKITTLVGSKHPTAIRDAAVNNAENAIRHATEHVLNAILALEAVTPPTLPDPEVASRNPYAGSKSGVSVKQASAPQKITVK